jgi:hypothetical protein
MDDSDQDSINQIVDLLPGVKILSRSECHLLGAPLTTKAIPQALKEKIATVSLLVARLSGLQPHMKIFILKNCLSIPKTSLFPQKRWKEKELLGRFDTVMRNGLESLLNISLDDTASLQTSLTVSCGGIGN